MSAYPMLRFLYWLHHNITAGLHGNCEVAMVNGRLVVRKVGE